MANKFANPEVDKGGVLNSKLALAVRSMTKPSYSLFIKIK